MSERGDRIGPYELVEPLGERGGVRHWRAQGDAGGQAFLRVASSPGDLRAVAAVRREYEVLRSLDSAAERGRVRRTLGFFTAQGAAAFEWIDGPSLRDVLRLAGAGLLALDPATRLDILVEVAHALRQAHGTLRPEGQIVHGGLSAKVVRLASDGRVVVAEFGVVHADVPFAPPELGLTGWTAAADQWLLGALAVHVFTGEPLADARAETVAEAVAHVGSACEPMERVVGRMLAPPPGERYNPESALLRELLAVGRYLGGPPRRAEVAAAAMRLAGVVPQEETPRTRGVPKEALPRVYFQAEQPLEEVVIDDGSAPTGPLAVSPRDRRRARGTPAEEEELPLPRKTVPLSMADVLPMAALIVLIFVGMAVLVARLLP